MGDIGMLKVVLRLVSGKAAITPTRRIGREAALL